MKWTLWKSRDFTKWADILGIYRTENNRLPETCDAIGDTTAQESLIQTRDCVAWGLWRRVDVHAYRMDTLFLYKLWLEIMRETLPQIHIHRESIIQRHRPDYQVFSRVCPLH